MRVTLLWICFFSFISTNAQFITPVEGDYLKDYFIVNYPDEDSGENIKETYCGTKTYNGHQGTDFVLRNFRQMDSGVYVLAAADGYVFQVVQNKFDRNKTSDTSLGFGNWVGVYHQINGKNYYTYYAHLRTNSVIVDSGQTVKAGDRLGLIGSSGNSSDPHLHFELWTDSNLIDPFEGGCITAQTKNFWNQPLPYDTSLININQGFTFGKPVLGSLKEAPENMPVITNLSDSFYTYWWQGTRLRKNDSISIIWVSSADSIWYVDYYISEKDFWYVYSYSYIFNPFHVRKNPPLGKWKVLFYVNRKLINQNIFEVKEETNGIFENFERKYSLTNQSIIVDNNIELGCMDLLGREIPINKNEINGKTEYIPNHRGIVIYQLQYMGKFKTIKAMLND